MLDVRSLDLPGLLEIRPPRFADERGFFSETWNEECWRGAGIDLAFVQDNHSLSVKRGVLRGLHFQSPPVAQDKLVRVTRGPPMMSPSTCVPARPPMDAGPESSSPPRTGISC